MPVGAQTAPRAIPLARPLSLSRLYAIAPPRPRNRRQALADCPSSPLAIPASPPRGLLPRLGSCSPAVGACSPAVVVPRSRQSESEIRLAGGGGPSLRRRKSGKPSHLPSRPLPGRSRRGFTHQLFSGRGALLVRMVPVHVRFHDVSAIWRARARCTEPREACPRRWRSLTSGSSRSVGGLWMRPATACISRLVRWPHLGSHQISGCNDQVPVRTPVHQPACAIAWARRQMARSSPDSYASASVPSLNRSPRTRAVVSIISCSGVALEIWE